MNVSPRFLGVYTYVLMITNVLNNVYYNHLSTCFIIDHFIIIDDEEVY